MKAYIGIRHGSKRGLGYMEIEVIAPFGTYGVAIIREAGLCILNWLPFMDRSGSGI